MSRWPVVGTFVALTMAWAGELAATEPASGPASGPSDGAPAPAAQLTSPHWWLRAAVEHAAGIASQADAGASRARRDRRTGVLTNILHLQVQAGDAEGALAAARRHAPQLLPPVAHAQARLGDANGALATAGLISDADARQDALARIADGLIAAGKLADARRALLTRAADERTGGLYEMLAKAQAKAGDITAAQASTKAIDEAPAGDGLNGVRRADALVAIAAAQARAGDRQAYRESLASARRLTGGFRPTYERNTLVRIARAQADAGDYEAAAETLGALEAGERARFLDLVLTAQVRRGDVSPAQALAKVVGYSPVYEAAMEVQLAAKDHKGAAQTFEVAKGQSFLFSDIPSRIVDGFLAAADVDGAAGFVEGLTDPAMRAQLYAHVAARRAAAGAPTSYQTFFAKALAGALQVVDPPPMSSTARPRRRSVLGRLAQIQADANDFEGAKKTVAHIDAPEDRRGHEVELRARELAASRRLEDARAWVASLPDAEDRAQACRVVAVHLMPAPKRP